MQKTNILKSFSWRWLAIVAATVVLVSSLVFGLIVISADSVSAENANTPPVDGGAGSSGGNATPDQKPKTSILPNDLDVIGLLVYVIWIMTAGIGVVAVAGIVWGSILYTSAAGNQEKTKKGIEIIRNVAIGLLLYVFMFAIINFLVPGGVIE